ncbi:MAG: guanylate kinase [Clostridia bacterium]|nr:guanylate kinase [Clostridia bacterium]
MNNNALLIVFSGPSGVGKDTVLKKLLKKKDNIKISVSATTRKQRKGEIDTVDYFFISKEQFLAEIEKDGMIEYAQYCDNFYGTPKEKVFDDLNKGYDVILEIETQGALQVIDKFKEAVSIFIAPPSFGELENRLKNRHTDSDDVIAKRLAVAKKELALFKKYDYTVINDDIDECVDNIINIINSEKLKSSRTNLLFE